MSGTFYISLSIAAILTLTSKSLFGLDSSAEFDLQEMVSSGQVIVCTHHEGCDDDSLELIALDKFKSAKAIDMEFVLANQSTGNIWGIRLLNPSGIPEDIDEIRIERIELPPEAYDQWSDAQYLLN